MKITKLQMNNKVDKSINLNMKESKEETFKRIILDYLIKQIFEKE